MKMNLRFICLSISMTFILFGCNGKSLTARDSSELIQLNRFDKELYDWIESDSDSALNKIQKDNKKMFDLLGRSMFKTDVTKSPYFNEYLINFYSEPNLKALYKDAISLYAPDSAITIQVRDELTTDFENIKKLFPNMQIPAVYFHVSGFLQKIIIADSLISMSTDMYLGKDYPLYNAFFEDYQRKSMTPNHLSADCAAAWLKSEYQFNGNENILLDRMIYEGKIIYILKQINGSYTLQKLLSLTDGEYKWCVENESSLWTVIIERKHLYTPDIGTTSKYFLPMPSTFIAENAPGNLGNFIGYKIIESYMKKTKSTCEELMSKIDAQTILKESKYKP